MRFNFSAIAAALSFGIGPISRSIVEFETPLGPRGLSHIRLPRSNRAFRSKAAKHRLRSKPNRLHISRRTRLRHRRSRK